MIWDLRRMQTVFSRCGVWSQRSSSTKTGRWIVANTASSSLLSNLENDIGSQSQLSTELEWECWVTPMDLSSVSKKALGEYVADRCSHLTTSESVSYHDFKSDFICVGFVFQTHKQAAPPSQTAEDRMCLRSWLCFRTQCWSAALVPCCGAVWWLQLSASSDATGGRDTWYQDMAGLKVCLKTSD